MSFKISFLLLPMIFFFNLHTSAQASIEFKQTRIDVGKIAENGGKVSRDFIFRNIGDAPLIILSVATSCTCTKATYPKNPISVGQEGVITVSFDPRKQNGSIYKAINIYCNTPSKREVIILSGSVHP